MHHYYLPSGGVCMKALSLRPAIRSLVSGCAVLVAAWLVLAAGAGGTRAAPSDPPTDKRLATVGCWSAYAVPTVGPTRMDDAAALGPNDVWTAGTQLVGMTDSRPRIHHWDGSSWRVVLSPTGSNATSLSSIEAFAANDIWVAGRDGGASYFMRWNGANWSIVSTPDIGPVLDLSALSPTDMWAVSKERAIHWNGSNWAMHALPSALLGPDRAIEMAAPDQVWVGGPTDPSAPKMLHWNGSAWTTVDLPALTATEYEVSGIDALSPTEIWAVGYFRESTYGEYTPLTLRWNGSQWTRVPVPQGFYGYRLSAVAALSSTDVWAVGGSGDYGLAQILHWDGQYWTVLQLPPEPMYGELRSVAAISSSDVWTVGGPAAGYSGMLMLHYSDPCSPPSPTPTGTPTATPTAWPIPNCWTDLPVPLPTSATLIDVDGVSSDDVWAVSSYPDTLIHWNGSAWSPVSGLPSDARINAVEALAPDDVWIVGGRSTSSGSTTLTAHWNGSHWSVVPSPNGSYVHSSLTSISALASDDIWAIGNSISDYPGPGRVLTMHWNGSQWTDMGGITVGHIDVLKSVSAISPTDVWAGGYYSLQYEVYALVIRWNGAVWQRVDVPVGGEFPIVDDVEAISGNDVWISASQALSVLHWDGIEWRGFPGSDRAVRDIESLSSSEVWAVGGGIHRWRGYYWELAVDTPPYYQMFGVAPINSNDMWVVGLSTNWMAEPPRPLALHYTANCPPPPASPTPTPIPPRCPTERFTDVCPTDYFYQPVLALSDLGIVMGYSTAPPCDGPAHIPCFKPYNGSTRGQIAKVVSLAAGFSEPVSGQTFEDVLPGSTFYEYIERMAARSIIQGYPCGGVGEPCSPANRPYFRPNNPVTRGQLSKMTSEAFGFSEPVSGQTFEDVPPGSTFYEWVQRLAFREIISGYWCGGQGEPCGTEERPYFRPNNHVTRGQTAKIVYLAMLPTPTRP
jgi:hypothetical protein